MKAIRVAVVMNVLPDYQAPFFQRLTRIPGLAVRLFCQPSIPSLNLKLVHEQFPDHVTLVRAWSLEREQFGWQWLPWSKLLGSFDVLFVMGNPRVLSNVVLSILARLLGRRVVLWGQGHSMQAPPWRERLRLFWWRRFDYILVYTDQEAKQLRTQGFGRKRVIGMNNGLDQQEIDRVSSRWGEWALEEWRRHRALDGHVQVLSCARLEPKNEFDLWLTAMPAVMSRHPSLLWCVIGDGRERAALERRARELGVADHVRWLGAVTDEAELAPWFLTSRLLVHPAGIGLTLLHAFGYGLPVVTHDEPAAHNPEIAAFLPGETGLAYRRGDAASLADAVSRCLEDDVARHRMGERERRIAREEYNVDVMAERWARMATEAIAGVRAVAGS